MGNNNTAMHRNTKPILFKSLALGIIIAVMLLMSACVFTASANSASSGQAPGASAPAGTKASGDVDADPVYADPAYEKPAYTSPVNTGSAHAGMQAGGLPPGTVSSACRRPGQGDASISTLRCIHFNEKDFRNSIALTGGTSNTGASGLGIAAGDRPDTGISEARDTSDSADGAVCPVSSGSPVAGGVVPHHLLAGKMIAQFFRSLSESSPDTIVIIGPNHDRIGMNELHTSSLNWATAFGILENNREITMSLINELGASENIGLMETEHSISSLVPYVKYYMPNTKIVPILLHGSYTVAKSQKLGKFLSELVKDDPGIIVIASVDFSHYLDADTAEKMDRITLDAIISRDTVSISRMGNDNIDSPPSILSLLCIMDEIGAIGPEVIAHDNSFGISGSGAECTTSYFTMFFRRP